MACINEAEQEHTSRKYRVRGTKKTWNDQSLEGKAGQGRAAVMEAASGL